MSGPCALAALAVAALCVLAAVVLVDKVRPLRHLDDRPEPRPTDVPGPWLGDSDLNQATDERIAAEHNLHRRLR